MRVVTKHLAFLYYSNRMSTKEFEDIKNDESLNAEQLADGTLVFKDGNAFLLIGPSFTNLAESEDFAVGDTKEQAIDNYAAGRRDNDSQ